MNVVCSNDWLSDWDHVLEAVHTGCEITCEPLLSTPYLVMHWQPERSRGGSVYTRGIGKRYKSGPPPSGEPATYHPPAHRGVSEQKHLCEQSCLELSPSESALTFVVAVSLLITNTWWHSSGLFHDPSGIIIQHLWTLLANYPSLKALFQWGNISKLQFTDFKINFWTRAHVWFRDFQFGVFMGKWENEKTHVDF